MRRRYCDGPKREGNTEFFCGCVTLCDERHGHIQTAGHGNEKLQDLIGNTGDTTVKTVTMNENNLLNGKIRPHRTTLKPGQPLSLQENNF